MANWIKPVTKNFNTYFVTITVVVIALEEGNEVITDDGNLAQTFNILRILFEA